MNAASLSLQIDRLRRLQRNGGVQVVTQEGATDWYEVMLYAPASEGAIATAESLIGKTLPAEFHEFWNATNGANLFLNESGLHGIGVASTELILELQQEEAEIYGAQALEPYAVFGRVHGSGDFLVFELRTGRILDGIHAEQPHEWRAIADSFAEWLDRLIEARGRYYWLEALYENG